MMNENKNLIKNSLKWIYFIPATIISTIGIGLFWKWCWKSSVHLFFISLGYADNISQNEMSLKAIKLLNNDYYNLLVELSLAPLVVGSFLIIGNILGPDNKNKKMILEYLVLINFILAIPIGIYTSNLSLSFVSALSVVFLFLFKNDFKILNNLILSLKNNKIALTFLYIASIYMGLAGFFLCYYIYLFAQNHSFLETLFLGPIVCSYKAILWIFLL
jgi:hypothetical protein